MTVQWILTSSILILAVAALGRALGSRVPARLRYALWLVVLARLLLPVQLFTVTADFIPQAQLPEVLEQKNIYVIPTGSVPVENISEMGAYLTEDGQVGMMASMGCARLEDGGETVVRYLDKVSPLEILGAVWKLGAAAMLLALALSNFRFSRRLKRVRAPLLEVMEGKLPVYQAEGLPGPCLFGVLRPAIYVTEEVLADERALRHVLAHETTHYRHADHIWSALRGIALAIHWWNPLVWLAVVRSKQDSELACDEGALQQLGDAERVAYGETLLTLITASASPADMLRCTTTMTCGMKEMKRRIQHIACKQKHLVILSAALVIALSILAACSFAAPKEENAVSDEARRVIKVMMTAPNEDLVFNMDLALNSRPTEEEEAAARGERNRVLHCWEEAIGGYFSEDAVSKGLDSSTLNAFQTRSRDFQKEFAVVDMSQVAKDESREDVAVTYTANGEEHHILVQLHTDADGKFCEVSYDLVDAPGTLKPLLLYIIGIADEPDDAAIAQAAKNEAAENEAAATGDPFGGEAVEKAFGELIAYRANAPLTLTMETAAGEKNTYSISSHNDFNVEHVSLYLSEDWQYSHVSEADWNALSAAEKGTVMTLEDRTGKIFRCCSGSDLLCLTMYGEVRYLRAESTDSAGSVFNFARLIADDAARSWVWDSAVVDGSITDLEEVTELLMEQVTAKYLALPSWVNGNPLDMKLAGGSPRVFDAYWGEPAQFCCDMVFGVALDDANTDYWQAGAGLSEPVTVSGMNYYGWSCQALVARDTEKNLWYIADRGSGGYSVNLPGYSLSVGTENYLGNASLDELLDMILLTEGFTHDYLLPKYALSKPDEKLSGINDLIRKRTAEQQEAICACLAGFVQGEYAGNSAWTLEDLRELLAPEYQSYLN